MLYINGSYVLHFARIITKFCKMSIHIGKNIHSLIKSKGIKAKTVAKAINVSESSLYKIYKRKTIDIDKLLKFSQYLDVNLFIHYFEQEPLKSMFRKEAEKLTDEIKNLKLLLEQRDKRINELEGINASQQKILTLLENSQGKTETNKSAISKVRKKK
jgi:transcriptional regulator with XRE-family HTH domain